jgi:DME family drug/metabolite transporter
VATLLEPLTAVVLSTLLLGQPLAVSQWVGGALLLVSIAVLGRRGTALASGDTAR